MITLSYRPALDANIEDLRCEWAMQDELNQINEWGRHRSCTVIQHQGTNLHFDLVIFWLGRTKDESTLNKGQQLCTLCLRCTTTTGSVDCPSRTSRRWLFIITVCHTHHSGPQQGDLSSSPLWFSVFADSVSLGMLAVASHIHINENKK